MPDLPLCRAPNFTDWFGSGGDSASAQFSILGISPRSPCSRAEPPLPLHLLSISRQTHHTDNAAHLTPTTALRCTRFLSPAVVAGLQVGCLLGETNQPQPTHPRTTAHTDLSMVKCNDFFRQFGVLVRKNFLIKRRSKLQLVSERALDRLVCEPGRTDLAL